MGNPEDDLLRNLLSTFRTEAAEHIQTLNQALLQLERAAPDGGEAAEHSRQALVQDAFRAAHSLKGAARAVGLTDIEGLAHGLEAVLHAARAGRLSLAPATCDVLYEALDAIQQRLAAEPVATEALSRRLTELVSVSRENISESQTAPDGQPEAGLISAADAAARAPSTPQGVSVGAPGEDSIRVALDKLDDLMAQVGELLIAKISAEQHLVDTQDVRRQLARWPRTWREIKALAARVNGDTGRQLAAVLARHDEDLQALAREVNTLHQAMNRDTQRLGLVATGLQDSVRRVRMVPFQTLIFGLQRVARDAARSEAKRVALRVEGGEVELDKRVLEMLKDPLLHLARNAVSHGIETPDRRASLGKPAEGQVRIAVQQRGGEVRIAVSDDGQGFDLDALRRAATRNGGPALDETAGPDDIIALAFQPGVTTAEQVTALAGRGVGLDVVRRCLEAIQGRVVVESVPGQGVTIQLLVPTSVAMTRGLLVRIGAEDYLLPLPAIEKIVELKAELVFTVEGRPAITVEGRPLPLVSLAAALNRPQANRAEHWRAIILSVAEQRLAVLVDAVLTEQELAVKPLGRLLPRVRPVVILNAADLVKSARGLKAQPLPLSNGAKAERRPSVRVLVVDDSITTRTLEKNILETAGYEVMTATDGVGALEQLKQRPVEVVVADIQMPNMDGFALTQHLRQSNDYHTLPIILVTSLESREDRERGLVAGANAYIVKRGFDQAELLATIQSLL